jgi:predicted amidohydrolase YtcJ
MRKQSLLLLFISIGLVLSSCATQTPADIVLRNGEIYTMEEAEPWAAAVVINGNTITAVLKDDAEADDYIGSDTRVVDLGGKFVLPGFIDGHVHFNRAGELILDANLMNVADDDGLRKEMERVAGILEDGEWITGGLWGAYEQWALGADKADTGAKDRWEPSRDAIDDVTPNNPCLLYSFDRALYLANTPALEAAGLADAKLQGMKLDGQGKPTGLLYKDSPAIVQIQEQVKPKSHKRMLNENRAALKKLAESGVVEVQDITGDEQMKRYIELQNNGELTARIWMRPDLSRGTEFKEKGIKMGTHPKTGQEDHYLRWGAFKGYIDGIMGTHGALFFEPYDDQPDNYGHYRRHTSDGEPPYLEGNMEKMYELLEVSHEGGYVANVHAIGTKGVALMLDTYERLMEDLGTDLTGYRVIHAQVIREEDFPRFKQLNVIAEINPYHLSDDMRWMEERIGHERCKGAYAFKSLVDNGATLVFGSDWPGTSAAEYHVHPKYLIHAAVNRTTLKHLPEGGWFPEQKISVEDALKAYTINCAEASFEGDVKGSIKAGKLADITVIDRNLLEIDPKDILNMEVLMTIVDGKVVFETM